MLWFSTADVSPIQSSLNAYRSCFKGTTLCHLFNHGNMIVLKGMRLLVQLACPELQFLKVLFSCYPPTQHREEQLNLPISAVPFSACRVMHLERISCCRCVGYTCKQEHSFSSILPWIQSQHMSKSFPLQTYHGQHGEGHDRRKNS